MVRTLSLGEADGADPDPPVAAPGSVVADPDSQLALWMLYELAYRGFDDVRDELEWDPAVLRLRSRLEEPFERELRDRTDELVTSVQGVDVVDALFALTEPSGVPALAAYIQRDATPDEVRAFLCQRSIYHLRESDPQSMVLARIDGPAKVALAELQYDEYGAGEPDRLHSTLFARALEGAGLDSTYGAHIGRAAASTLAVNNAMSLFALHGRLRGAALGHLAAFEATSSIPCRMIAAGLERLGFPEPVIDYYREHVEADAAHEQVAIRDICGSLAAAEPHVAEDILWGAAVCLHLDDVAAEEQMSAWTAVRESASEEYDTA